MFFYETDSSLNLTRFALFGHQKFNDRSLFKSGTLFTEGYRNQYISVGHDVPKFKRGEGKRSGHR